MNPLHHYNTSNIAEKEIHVIEEEKLDIGDKQEAMNLDEKVFTGNSASITVELVDENINDVSLFTDYSMKDYDENQSSVPASTASMTAKEIALTKRVAQSDKMLETMTDSYKKQLKQIKMYKQQIADLTAKLEQT